MKSTVEIDTERPGEIAEILGQSLDSDMKVDYDIEVKDEKAVFTVEADGIGPLRGATDSVFRLGSLALKLY
ncbi:MAG: hypothetical protein ABEK01_04250 [Candidatus Nanohaloarchaea archaeon]